MATNRVDIVSDLQPDDPVGERLDNLESVLDKYDPRKRKGSVIKSAQQNVFEFPVFVSSTIPMDYATATVSLLEQTYAAYLQMAISINPVVDADTVKKGLQFANYKTNTNKYLEYTDTMYQHAICDNVIQEGDYNTAFSLLSYEDNVGKIINEAMDYEVLSEFDHFWQEAPGEDERNFQQLYPLPLIAPDGNLVFVNGQLQFARDDQGRLDYRPLNDVLGVLGTGTITIPGQNGQDQTIPATDYYMNYMHIHRDMILPSRNDMDDHIPVNHAHADAMADAQLAGTQARGRVDAANAAAAERHNNRYYRANDAISTGAQTFDNVMRAANDTTNVIYNVSTLKDRIQNAKLSNEKLRGDLADREERLRIDKNTSNAKIAAPAPEYVDDSKCQKLNTMKPLLMKVTVNMLNKDDSLQPINYIIGVKTHTRVVPADILPEVAKYPLKEMDKLARKVKWRAGELKFFRDLVFRIKEKKQTAVDSRDPRRKWFRRLYELAHMQGDAPAASIVQGKSLFKTFLDEKRGKGKLANGLIPNASIVMSQADVDNIKAQTGINLLKDSTAKKFCGELFLISFVIIDTDSQTIKIMMPDMNGSFDNHSLASVEKQLATLSTAGTKTRDIFKMLG